ncbi:MAG: sulfatase-like hydrolase/transferase [Acidobacteria bacterium]|nr:sulfatase-like hydrolase/transferase [Acidobacteriota bacterium]
MVNRITESRAYEGNRSGAVLRFFVFSSLIGFLIGLFEAALLWKTPHMAALLVPDVRYVVWFLAPLLDMVFFGVLGLGLGWVACRAGYQKMLVAVQIGIAGTFVYLTLHWFHIKIGLQPFSPYEDAFVPFACFSLVFALSLLFLIRGWVRVGGYFERWAGTLVRPLAWGLLAATIVAVVGIVAFIARISFSANTAEAATPPPAGSPNIILITLDTVRADHLSAYGYSRPTTPHLDRFAQQGVLFENAIAATSWTLASHASIFTGLLPHQHGADWTVPLPRGPHTLAEILGSRGYETAGFTSNLRYCDKGWGIARGFEAYEDSSDSFRHNLAQTFLGEALIQPLYQDWCRYDLFDRRNAQELNASIFHWFRHRSKRPYFLFINYFDAHDPYLTSGSYNHRFGKIPISLLRRVHLASYLSNTPQRLSPSEQAAEISAYDNCLAYLDDHVGRLSQFLRQSPGWQNTIVIITSDHGEAFGEHGYYGHGYDLYREVLHVPLIIVGPGVPRGLRIQHVVGIRELFATVLDLAGGGKTPFSGRSLARFWHPGFKPQPGDDAVVSELAFPELWENKVPATISLTTPEWQYIYDSAGRQELYRWTTDPLEQSNLAASPDEQATLDSLHAQLVGLIQNSVGPWRGAEYLVPLEKQRSFLREVLFPPPFKPGAPGNQFRIGASQAYFGPERPWTPPRPSPAQQDLMKSLPYH